ncbi:thiol-disulfide oxidoreductase DCC family protein [Inhella sp.]|uniref:thiol-disulfide oxidoreductase DCC family protein n=1 Tax=Inhella sp. TaxID=1921806 RepID=UPI0035B3F44D
MNATHPEYTVYFDGSCQLCRAEMHNLMLRNTEGRVAFIDAAAPGFDAAALGVTQDALMNALHVRRHADGQWLIAVPAFEALYRTLGLPGVAAALRQPTLARWAARAYPWLVRNRHRLPQAPVRWLFERAGRRAAERAAARRCTAESCER